MYDVYISDDLFPVLKVEPEAFPGILVKYNPKYCWYQFILTENDVKLAKRLILKNCNVDRVKFDGNCFAAYRDSESN